MKPPGSLVTLRRTFWHAPEPVPGDVIETSTGRRYEINAVQGKRLVCRVLRSGQSVMVGARVFYWVWNDRHERQPK